MRLFLYSFAMWVSCCFQVAVAQEIDWHRFYPLEERNTWEYYYEWRQNSNLLKSSYVRRTIVGQTGPDRYLIRTEEFDTETLALQCEATYEIGYRSNGFMDVPWDAHACVSFITTIEQEGHLAGGEITSPASVAIGGEQYPVEAVERVPVYRGDSEISAYFATDIGFYKQNANSGCCGYWSYDDLDLLYAYVGGVEYGRSPFSSGEDLPVSTEDETAPVAFALSAPYPNPFRTTISLTVRLPVPEPVKLEVFDMIGRCVFEHDLGIRPAGSLSHQVNLSDLPSGLYVVRATAASGKTAVQRIVKAE